MAFSVSTPGVPLQYNVEPGISPNPDVCLAPNVEQLYRLHTTQSGVAVVTSITSGQFGILAPTAVPPIEEAFHASQKRQGQKQKVQRSNGQLSSKIIVDPPDLELWRDKLFNVDDMIVLTHEQFETYFPHIDNVSSHRSTQRYKRKPFISHYWDCRMKGRPPGTPKSDDPNKKKRKRSTRQRDLCDVKIKITEYFPGAQIELDNNTSVCGDLVGQRLRTIQRVNGNGGNGKGDGVAGPHKHTLERSNEIKKNSVQRLVAKQGIMKYGRENANKSALKATGPALITARKHAKGNDFKLYAACFCPFSQRIWIALEAKGMAYQYCETDPFHRPAQLLQANHRDSCVPTVKHGDWACSESAVVLEYIEDLGQGATLLPTDPRSKADCRFWIDHINRHVVPNFFSFLQNRDPAFGCEAACRLQKSIETLVEAADVHVRLKSTSQCLLSIY
ncbi:hypothetical protein KAF25_001842 [Fusarium avenaceum]|uniref:GST N-terminal domain-containing protein n=1 Tax=Fusarium avenaceum TaxID=40199 RepID=A0A9P7KNY1_9HYPO|nr:hypothetical protein KAF25_001842 [Fusarium avenaceum]